MAYEEARCKDAKKLVEQHAAKSVLAELAVGDLVSIQDPRLGWWSGRGVIKKIRPSGRAYEVETSAGIFIRKRRQLRKLPTSNYRPISIEDDEGDLYLADGD